MSPDKMNGLNCDVTMDSENNIMSIDLLSIFVKHDAKLAGHSSVGNSSGLSRRVAHDSILSDEHV